MTRRRRRRRLLDEWSAVAGLLWVEDGKVVGLVWRATAPTVAAVPAAA